MTLLPSLRFSAANRRVCVLTAGRLCVHQWQGGRAQETLSFRPDEAGLGRFSKYLESAPPLPIYILVDVVEEEFRHETIPHVMGGDRRALVKTRQNRLFRECRYAHAIFQGREPDGRRDDRVLFTALIRQELLDPWIGQIERHKIPLVGIYSLPVVGGSLLKRIPANSTHTLLVTLQGSGGLRQTFFEGKDLKISRLAYMPKLDASQVSSYILGEVEKLRRYLNSLRLLSRDTPLDVFLLGHGRILGDLRHQAADTVATRYHLVDVADMASKVGLKGELATPFADALFARLLATEAPPNYYGTDKETRYIRLHRARIGMKAAGVLLLAGSIAWSGYQFFNAVVTRDEASAFTRQAHFYQERYALGQKTLPKAPADAYQLKTAVEMAEVLKRYRSTPEQMMRVLSRALDGFPGLYIKTVDWKTASDPKALVGAEKASAQSANPYAGGANTNEGETLFQLAWVDGQLDPFDGNFREALKTLNRFIAALEKNSVVESARLMKVPLDTSSQGRMTGQTGGVGASKGAEFSIRIVVRADHEIS